MSGIPRKRPPSIGGTPIEHSPSKKQRFVDAAKMLLDIDTAKVLLDAAKDSADVFPPLKSCLRVIRMLIRHYDEYKDVRDKLDDLASWLGKLLQALAKANSNDPEEVKRQSQLARSVEDIGERSLALLNKGEVTRVLDKKQESQKVIGLIEDIREAILTYQVSQQQSIYNQVVDLTPSFGVFLNPRQSLLAEAEMDPVRAQLDRLRAGGDAARIANEYPREVLFDVEGQEGTGDGELSVVLSSIPRATLVSHSPSNPHLSVGDAREPVGPAYPSILTDPQVSACERLLSGAFYPHELISLIGEVFTRKDEVKMIGCLSRDAAQAFVDVVYGVLDVPDLPSQLRRKFLGGLRWTCGRHALLPKSLQIPFSYDRLDHPLYRGEYADVWKGEHQGRHVAVKVLGVSLGSDLDKIMRRFCKEVVTWKALHHPNVLPLLGVTMDARHFAMASEWMVNGNINEFIEAYRDANRPELLKDVARGLVYMHSQAMVHGDLKGANILIDRNHHALLADFGLLTIVSDTTSFTSSSSHAKGGTTRWMSPERLDPDHFGLEDSQPTKESDRYALGMVVLEVLSGRAPFASYDTHVVMRKVAKGERPGRPEGPEGAWFTDDLWQVLELCWSTPPERRPSIEAVLECLERVSVTWEPPSRQTGEGVGTDEDYLNDTTDSLYQALDSL